MSFKVGDAVWVRNPEYNKPKYKLSATAHRCAARVLGVFNTPQNTCRILVNWNPLGSDILYLPAGSKSEGTGWVTPDFLTAMSEKEEREQIEKNAVYAGLTGEDYADCVANHRPFEKFDDGFLKTRSTQYMVIAAKNYNNYRVQIDGFRGMLC